MDILFVYNSCSPTMYETLHEGATYRVLPQDQKFYSLIIEGLKENGASVTCLSGRPINRAITRKLYFKKENERVDGVDYEYCSFFNFPILRQINNYRGCYKYAKKYFKAHPNSYAIINVLCMANATAVIKAAKKYNIRTVGIITDPLFDEHNKRKFKTRNKIMSSVDSYIFLTRQMNELINPTNKPYVVIEGQCDHKLSAHQNSIEEKITPKRITYAGAISKEYGLKTLVESFIKSDNTGWELQLFGNGDYVEEINGISKTHNNVKYLGSVSNKQIVKAEIESTLLVNPRPVGEYYTIFSFPSKTLEYMVSGTPVLTTDLPGIPEEYKPYLYYFSDDTKQGMIDTLNDIFSKSDEELFKKGQKAKAFALEHKNNISQSKRIIEFLNKLSN